MNKLIYLDNAATTKTAPEVVQAMLPWFTENYGNPSSIYSLGTESKKAVSEAKDIIAGSLALPAMKFISRPEALKRTTGR